MDRYASTNERIGSPFDSEGLMFGPGLECEHMMTFSVGSSALDANYEYSWSVALLHPFVIKTIRNSFIRVFLVDAGTSVINHLT